MTSRPFAIGRRALLRGAAATVAGGLGASAGLSGCGAPTIRDSFYTPTPRAPLTPASQWYINAYTGSRRLQASSWSLRVEGNVGREQTLDLAALGRFARHRVTMTMMCVGNFPGGGLMSAGEFSGVRLADVLDAARLRDTTRAVMLIGADGFPTLLETKAALASDALLASHLNGAPLPFDHGYPLRLVRPGRFGFRQPKWLVGVRALRHAPTVRVVGHAVNGLVADHMGVVSRIIWPREDRVQAGAVKLGGVAFSGTARIARVEVQVDTGRWTAARLTFNRPTDAQPSTLWSLWEAEVTLPRGDRRLRARAFDVDGRGQPNGFSFPYPSDSIHAVKVTAT